MKYRYLIGMTMLVVGVVVAVGCSRRKGEKRASEEDTLCFDRDKMKWEQDLASTGQKFYMLDNYTAEPGKSTKDCFRMIYKTDDPGWPVVVISEFPKGEDVSLSGYIDEYAAQYELEEGAVYRIAGYDVACISYQHDGTYYEKGYIDCGNTIVLIESESESGEKWEAVKSVIDTIHNPGI